jgi:hypothetical protein
MAEDLDPLLRSAMKTLDDEVPSGYFEALPDRLLAKLVQGGEVAMQQTETSNREPHVAAAAAGPLNDPHLAVAATASPAAPVAGAATGAAREEDSGLHDIRNLAQSTRQRVSKRMTTSPPPMGEEDILGGASASWKNLALPQPAKMVSLPEIEALPSKAELKAAQKAAKLESQAPAAPAAAVEAVGAPSTSGAVAYKPSFSAFQPKPQAASSKGRTIAIVSVLVAAAAGVAVYVATRPSGDAAAPQTVAQRGGSPDLGIDKDKMNKLDEATAKLEAEHRAALAAAEAPPVIAAAPSAGASDAAAVEPAKVAEKPTATKVAVRGKSAGKGTLEKTTEAPVIAKPEAKKPAGAEQDPSFDALLKEAGVKEKKTVVKLDKKELSGDEFKKGMAAITAKAQACYKGTQGSANVKLTIAPTGQVSKVTISGAFAGKPEADCVSAAIKAASFPAWDGGPQTFGYPILLSE